jgi:hypothetical protein
VKDKTLRFADMGHRSSYSLLSTDTAADVGHATRRLGVYYYDGQLIGLCGLRNFIIYVPSGAD